jgi:hypothetical protein
MEIPIVPKDNKIEKVDIKIEPVTEADFEVYKQLHYESWLNT